MKNAKTTARRAPSVSTRVAVALERIAETLHPGTINVPVSRKIIAPTLDRFHKISDEGKFLPFSAKSWNWVYDATTGLIWARSLLPKEHTFADAGKAASDVSLRNVSARLPTAHERMTIVDFARVEPAIDIDYFDPNQKMGWEWTSTVSASSPSGFAWFVALGSGGCGRDFRSIRYYVRAVLAGQSLGLSR